MTRAISIAMLAAIASCVPEEGAFVAREVETRFAFTNFSQRFYATLAIRENDAVASSRAYVRLAMLAPGATVRGDFVELLGTGCPRQLDLRVRLYRRVNEDVPIGLDAGEAVEATPIAAGEILGVPACSVVPLETYTIVIWDAPEGTARVKLAQGTPVESAIIASGIFPNVDAAWEIEGVDSALADTAAPPLAADESIAGRVTLADGTGIEGIGVLVRARFRIRLDDADTDNDPDAGFGDPIAFTGTDAAGAFLIERPAGAYRIEFFSDDFAFRPAMVEVESPIESIRIVAEPL